MTVPTLMTWQGASAMLAVRKAAEVFIPQNRCFEGMIRSVGIVLYERAVHRTSLSMSMNVEQPDLSGVWTSCLHTITLFCSFVAMLP